MQWQTMAWRLGGGALVLALSGTTLASPAWANDEPEVLPRSIYVPVRFEVASCLRDVVIRTEAGAVRAVAPGRLVSQFTFFDSRPGSNPEWERLTVEGWVEGTESEDGGPARFRAGVVITPASIYIGKKRLDLELEDELDRFRWRTDLRYPERTLRLRPASKCDDSVTAADRHRPPPAGS